MWGRTKQIVMLIGFLGGCEPHPELLALRGEVKSLSASVVHLKTKLDVLQKQAADGLAMALCTPEIRQVLEDVSKECTVDLGNGEMPVCSTSQIKPAVLAADPTGRGRLLKMMSHIPHEPLYLSHKSTTFPPHRLERLAKLTKPAFLDRIVFLVVSSPATGEQEADRRAKVAKERLRALGVPLRKIQTWKYSFHVDPKEIVRTSDKPTFGEPGDYDRGVWIFRADC